MQKLIVIGNLTHDPELSQTQSGIARCSFSVAVNRNYTRADGERGCDFFNAIAWRGLGENIAKYCTKGSKIYLEGRLEQRFYEDNNGVKRTVYDYLIDSAEFLPNAKRGENETAQQIEEQDTKEERSARKQNKKNVSFQSVLYDDDEIPF